MSRKKIIENRLPLRELSASAMTERAHKGHPGNLHLWWNRSPIASSAALLFAALVDENDIDAEELIVRMASGDKKAIQSSKRIAESMNKGSLSVVDPFSGFGGLTIAGEEIGLSMVSGDLNAMATLLTKAAAEIPGIFSNRDSVHPGAQRKISSGTNGLAGDVEYYGRRMGEEARKILTPIYPTQDGKDCFSWIWVRSTECANPACKCEMPLSSSFVLSRKKEKEYWAEPILEGGKTTFRIHKGVCTKENATNKVGLMGTKFACPFCGEIVTDEYVKKQGHAGNLHVLLMAVAVESEDGRDFYSPSQEQILTADISRPKNLPAGELPNNTKWFSTPGFGMKEYKDLYTARQLKMLCELSSLVRKYQSIITLDAKNAGMKGNEAALENGGDGALAYGQAVSVYLGLVLGRMTNYHSSICTWDNRKGNLRAAFTRQALPMTWTYAEGNPFSSITGNYDSCLMNVVDSIRDLPYNGNVSVHQADGTRIDFPKESLLFTELPYLDNVGYADLSDYFYIWLRRSLSDVFHGLFEKIVTSKEELSSIPEHYGNDAIKGKKAYAEGIRRLFANFRDAASTEYPSMVFFKYSRSDEIAIVQGAESESVWEMFLGSIIHAGFQITRVWPIRTEKANDRFESVRTLIVFRPKKTARQTTRRRWVNILKKELPELLDEDFTEETDEEDKTIIAMGRGLAIFTRYLRILNADGSDMSVHDVLQLIYQETEEYKKSHLQESIP